MACTDRHLFFKVSIVLFCLGFLTIPTSFPICLSQVIDDEFAEFHNPDEATIIDLPDSSDDVASEAFHNEKSASWRQSADNDPLRDDNRERPNTESGSLSHPSSSPNSEPAQPSYTVEELQDDEEFEGILFPENDIPEGEAIQTQSSLPKLDAKPKLKIVQPPRQVFRSWDHYTIEMFLLCLIFIYLTNFTIGRGTNSRLANDWFAAHKELFDLNFSLVGDDGQANPVSGELTKDSECLYSLWCSGRVCCESMYIELRLLKRHDLISVIMNWFKPSQDTVMVKLNMDANEMDNWVFVMGQKKSISTLTKDHFDLATYPIDRRGQRSSLLPERFLVLNEIPEATAALLSPTVCKVIVDYQNMIDYLYFSDQYSGPRPLNEELKPPKPEQIQKVLIFSFNVGSKGVTTSEDMHAMKPLFNFIFYLIEKVRRIRLSKESKAKSERVRQKVLESHLKTVQVQRQEAAQNRREEQRRATKDRILSEEDPEKARRLEEKEQRKDNKRKQLKMKMLKVKGM